MRQLAAAILILFFCAGCGGVSSAWKKTKSTIGLGGDEPRTHKVTVETYPERTTVSTLENPDMEVQTKPTREQVEVRPSVTTPSVQTDGTSESAQPDREDLSPEERRLEEKIDEQVEELRRKHGRDGIWGIFN